MKELQTKIVIKVLNLQISLLSNTRNSTIFFGYSKTQPIIKNHWYENTKFFKAFRRFYT